MENVDIIDAAWDIKLAHLDIEYQNEQIAKSSEK